MIILIRQPERLPDKPAEQEVLPGNLFPIFPRREGQTVLRAPVSNLRPRQQWKY